MTAREKIEAVQNFREERNMFQRYEYLCLGAWRDMGADKIRSR
jgi:hypothetical protein